MTAGAALAAVLAGSVLFTSFLSGIFGMAGGMILLGVLLAVLDVAPTMVLFGMTQAASNGWRCARWRRRRRSAVYAVRGLSLRVAPTGWPT